MNNTFELRKVLVRPLKNGNVKVQIDVPDSLGELEEPKEVAPATCGTFRIMTEDDGDKRYTWDRRDYTQIREAKDFFDKCVAEGLVPYRVGVGGKPSSEVMTEFDPYAEEVVFMPVAAAVGG